MEPLVTLPSTRRGALLLERAVLGGPRGAIALRQRMLGTAERVVVTHQAGFAALVEVRAGRLSFPTSRGEVQAPGRFVLVVPARSVLRVCYTEADVQSDGIGTFSPLVDAPTLLGAATAVSIADDLLAGPALREVRLDDGAPPAIVRARALLHDWIDAAAPVRRIADALSVDPDVLTRGFTRAYGLGPKQYATRARLFDAAIRLFTGARVARAAFDAGYGDLTRFYAQFRRLLGATPGSYAAVGKRQDRRSAPR